MEEKESPQVPQPCQICRPLPTQAEDRNLIPTILSAFDNFEEVGKAFSHKIQRNITFSSFIHSLTPFREHEVMSYETMSQCDSHTIHLQQRKYCKLQC